MLSLSRLAIAALRTLGLCLMLHAAIFFIFDLLPDAVYSQLGNSALQPGAVEKLRERMGTDGPLYRRYLKSLRNIARLDLGKSLHTEFPVAPLIWQRLKLSAAPIGLATLTSLLFLWAGASLYLDRQPSRFKRAVLQVLPITMIPQFVTAAVFAIVSAQLSRSLQGAQLFSGVLFVISIAMLASSILFNAAASTALDGVQQPFVLTYLSYGLPWSRIQTLLLKNVLIQLLPLSNRVLLALITGTVFSELAFDRPGIGSLLAEAIRSGDQPVAMGWMLAVSLPLLVISQGVSVVGSYNPPT